MSLFLPEFSTSQNDCCAFSIHIYTDTLKIRDGAIVCRSAKLPNEHANERAIKYYVTCGGSLSFASRNAGGEMESVLLYFVNEMKSDCYAPTTQNISVELISRKVSRVALSGVGNSFSSTG